MSEHMFTDRRKKPERRHDDKVDGWHLCRRKITKRRQEEDQESSSHWWLHANYTVGENSGSQ